MADWIQAFFAILVIGLVIYSASWFFGFSIPNFQGIQYKVEKAKIPTTIELGNTDNMISNYLKGSGRVNMLEGDWDSTPSFLENKCREACSKQGRVGNEWFWVQYKSYTIDSNNNLICECSK